MLHRDRGQRYWRCTDAAGVAGADSRERVAAFGERRWSLLHQGLPRGHRQSSGFGDHPHVQECQALGRLQDWGAGEKRNLESDA